MFNFNITKRYYKCHHLYHKFINLANLLILLFNINNTDQFNIEYQLLHTLKLQYPTYITDININIIVQLLTIINILYNSNINLKSQIQTLETELANTSKYSNNTNNVFLNTQITIEQNTTIKLEYIQYVILFDLTQSDGLFLENNLEIARQVLLLNNGKLKY